MTALLFGRCSWWVPPSGNSTPSHFGTAETSPIGRRQALPAPPNATAGDLSLFSACNKQPSSSLSTPPPRAVKRSGTKDFIGRQTFFLNLEGSASMAAGIQPHDCLRQRAVAIGRCSCYSSCSCPQSTPDPSHLAPSAVGCYYVEVRNSAATQNNLLSATGAPSPLVCPLPQMPTSLM